MLKAQVDMNLLLRIAVFILIFAFLLLVVNQLTKEPNFTVRENNVGLEMLVLSLAVIVLVNLLHREKIFTNKKGVSMPTNIMVWAVIILVVIGLSLLIWIGIKTEVLPKALNFVWKNIFPF